jgi:GEVED domain
MYSRKLRLESLENRLLLASVVIAPVDADLTSINGSYLQFDANGNNWYNGSGLSNASIVETNDPVPAVWPTHLAGFNNTRVARIREAPEVSTLTFDLGGRFDLTGMALWNTTEATNTDSGFENTVLSYSLDNGLTFSGGDSLVWTQLAALTTPFGPEIKMLPATRVGVTHVRMNVDNFSVAGADKILTASEIRFLGNFRPFAASASLSVATVDGRFDLRQGVEGLRAVDAVVTLTEGNSTGAPITFDLTAVAGGTALSGLDYEAIAAGTKITVPSGSRTGTFRINVIDDFLIEATETLRLRISNPSNSSVTLGTTDATATIADNDTAGVTIVGADALAISEAGTTDTYTIALDTIPTGAVQITASADPQIQISVDGVHFSSTLILTFTDRTPQTITVRAVSDRVIEGAHTGTISHRITGTVVDPNYPDVTVESLYTQTGTDPTFDYLIANGILPDGVTSTAGVTGSTINVNNTNLEKAPYGNRAFEQNIRIHTLGNSSVPRPDFPKWSRWYQEDGRTQIYRIFEGEENTRNDREFAARIESFESGFNKGVWNDFSARYTILKPESMAIFQSFQDGVEWSVHLSMNPDGSVQFIHRRGSGGGGQQSIKLADDMIGKSFDVLIRDNGFDYEVYFNGELKGAGTYVRPTDSFNFRWGMYRGGFPMSRDALLFVSGATTAANTSAPVGLVPYRPATTSLSIASATATIQDFVQPQVPFIVQTVQPGTRILAEQFDLGWSGVAYFDTTPGNRGGQARPDEDVDLFAASIVLSDIADGEWLEFTRDVIPGIYDIDVRAWSNNSITKGVRLLIATDSLATSFTELASVNVPDTDDVRISQTIQDVDLTAWGGEDRVFRLEFFGSSFSYDWIEFRSELDFGDAPVSYSTLLANDGARHLAVGPQLGVTRDIENDGAPSASSNGDDAAGTTDDEDGVLFSTIAVESATAGLNIHLQNAPSAKVDAWIDFNRDGVFGTNEKIVNDFLVNQSMQTINYTVPSGLTTGDTYARVRMSSTGGLSPNGFASDGEVEDYVVSIGERPMVQSVVINGGDAQRSSVETVRVTFDKVVDFDNVGGNPFTFTHIASGDTVTAIPVIDNSSGKTVVNFTFNPAGLQVTSFGSLQNGDYRLTIHASRVKHLGIELDGDGNGTTGDNYVTTAADKFFRKYGDQNATGIVDLSDFAAFRQTFGKSAGTSGYLDGFDSNGDDLIGLADFAAFRQSFGT